MRNESELSDKDIKSSENILKYRHVNEKIIISCKWTIKNFATPFNDVILSEEFVAGCNNEDAI